MATCISASGKVLLAGGYLVLDPEYSGVVVSASSRFYTVINPLDEASPQIIVRSPQFKDAVWVYDISIDSSITVSSSGSRSKNKFVQTALQETFSLALEIHGRQKLDEIISTGAEIIIAGENDFYSQRSQLAALSLPPTLKSLESIQRFTPTGTTLAEVHKTGLGSSAALITSLATALLVYLQVIPKDALHPGQPEEHRLLMHNTAQYIHCLAQGKVGSGFDVASAVYGSHRYTRFNPDVLKPLMSANAGKISRLSVVSSANKLWDHKVVPFRLPPYTRLMLADVDAGSDTPSLVGKVLKWRSENPVEAKELWDSLAGANERFATALEAMSETHSRSPLHYQSALRTYARLARRDWFLEPMTVVHDAAQEIRAKMRLMGELSGVPIEPPKQTSLLDACMSQEGVLAGGVPGAGGYDAIWLLVVDPYEYGETGIEGHNENPVVKRIEDVWLNWKEMDVSPLAATESRGGGVRTEKVDHVPGLSKVFQKV